MDSIKTFFELLVKENNLPEFLANIILIYIYILFFFISVVKNFLALINWNNKRINTAIIKTDLYPSFRSDEILKYSKFYIQQKFQNLSPTENEEFSSVHAIAAKSNLLKAFIKGGLLRSSSKKYFMILADTGMGKTAFLINLYLKYKKLPKKYASFDIVLIPLGDTTALDRIKKIDNQINTILLLDAFDEDTHALNSNYKNRIEVILNETKNFRKIVFTCRTQFFPNQKEEPHDTNDMSFGDNNMYTIQKLYLSPFDNLDIFFYTLKKYKLNLFKLYKSNRLVSKCPNLMMRPMLLSYVDELLNEKKIYKYTYEIYEVLIGKWIEREVKKPTFINSKQFTSQNIHDDLLIFSKELAVNLYKERENRNGYYISISEIQNLSTDNKLYSEILTAEDKTGRSLLNRNSSGMFKFAHKSILEYFLAIELIENNDLLVRFDFEGMDATQNFVKEIIANQLMKFKGNYTLYMKDNNELWSLLSPEKIDSLNSLLILNARDLDYKYLYPFKKVTSIILVDSNFQLVYFIYLILFIQSNIKLIKRFLRDQLNNKIREKEGIMNNYELNFGNKFNDLLFDYEIEMREIKLIKHKIEYEDLLTIIENINTSIQIKNLFTEILEKFKNCSFNEIKSKDINNLFLLRNLIIKGKSEKLVLEDTINNLRKINQLTKINNNTKIIY